MGLRGLRVRNQRLFFIVVVVVVLLLGLAAAWLIGGWYEYPPVLKRFGGPFTPDAGEHLVRGTTAVPAVSRVARDDDIHLLARLIQAEAAAEPYHGKVAVGAVVLNRVRYALFAN